MKHMFYDVKLKTKVETEVVDKVAFHGKSGIRYAFIGRTDDDRKIMTFVGKALWDSTDI